MCYWIHLKASATAIMTRRPEAFSRVVPEGDACVTTLGLASAKCYCTRSVYVNVFFNLLISKYVDIGDALAMTLGLRVGEVLLRSSWVWVVPEGDALAMTLGFRAGEVLLRSSWVWVVPVGDALAMTLGFNGLK